MLFDSDIIIWALRGHANAQKAIQSTSHRAISAVTYIEVVRGLKNKLLLQSWKSFIHELDFEIIPINAAISHKAMLLCEEFSLSHGLELADALIAATADNHGLTLYTANIKHYRYIPNLVVQQFKE